MSGSTFGTLFCVTTWGESHGPALGVTIDGCPSGLQLNEADIQVFLDRRKPGQNAYSTARQESDTVEILSGVFEGRTTGTPITLLIRNVDQRSHDYSQNAQYYRPSHADYTYDHKYGFRDYRGGGRSSGRETVSRVAAGAIALKLLQSLGIHCTTYVRSIGPFEVPSHLIDYTHIQQNPLCMPHMEVATEVMSYLDAVKQAGDSVGGMIEACVSGLPIGLGEPVFDKLDADLAKAILSIGATKSVAFGDGLHAATSLGSEWNDTFAMEAGQVIKRSNHAGGVLGGMSDGSPLIIQTAIKPTPSISLPQPTINTDFQEQEVTITGRHDPIIAARAVVVVEAMIAITLMDHILRNMSSTLSGVQSYYRKDSST